MKEGTPRKTCCAALLAASRGARILDYLFDMSAVLRSELLALEPLTTVFRGAQVADYVKIYYTSAGKILF